MVLLKDCQKLSFFSSQSAKLARGVNGDIRRREWMEREKQRPVPALGKAHLGILGMGTHGKVGENPLAD